ncbi:SPL family radical SAM protein [Murimonas intestini]|uniref:Spore photoproduct lyase n=1 Tax=Murimonas intestini TaxID=1337051 RepID=A0AB73T0K0_9FIRM|nr:spore photoproduct lyase [Murimonas intestini]MCR1842360.1 spore photoproduct lyase [Murimonas intestini]MCR1867717.1 spore photoproduct lyase [Murimonas intestini]MCR1885971.1 spore photoproduct lyase [Murimonas intestini]
MFPDKIYYEPGILDYTLGQQLKEKYKEKPWIPIQSHNNIEELRSNPNSSFPAMKQHLIIGTRKTHRYVPNQKVSDFLVPYTSSGCTAMCLYCYLVCNYNKCSYLRLFVNREEMLDKIIRTAGRSHKDLTFEIGSNSDLVLENTITGNLEWTITNFARTQKGLLTFPTKFDMVGPLLPLEHKGRVIFRMSVNPQPIISSAEFGTASLKRRIHALNLMADAGYRTGILIAPIILTDNYQELYSTLLDQLSDELSAKSRENSFLELILMTYSFVHRKINEEAFPAAADLYDASKMTGRGMGKYCYRPEVRREAEEWFTNAIHEKLKGMKILYIS